MDVHNKVDCAFPREKLHVTVQVDILCCCIHLKCLPNKFDNNEWTHHCTESDLRYIYDLGPNGGTR